MKKSAKNLLYDRLHKGFVLTSVAVSLGTSVLIAIRVYHYFTVIRPLQKQLQLEQQQQLLREGMDVTDKNPELRM